MVDVLLTHSYHLSYDRKQVRKMQPYPPLATLYAAALLREHGFSVALFDTMLEDPEEGFPQALAQYQPRLVAVCEDNFNFLSKMCLTRMRQVAYEMAQAAHAAAIPVVVNGSDASDHGIEYLQHGFDYVLRGEPEWTLVELARAVLVGDGSDLDKIGGLMFLRDRNGALIQTPPRPPMRDLDAFPCPARDLIDTKRYRSAWKAAHGFFSLNIITSRGCPFRCNWCAKPIYGNSFQYRSPGLVAREMKQLKHECGAEHLWFADDIFALRSGWAQEFADAVHREDAVLPFKIQSRVDLMTRRTVRALSSAGCAEVWMGAESGSQRILDAMEKDTRVEQIVAARENLRQYGIRACYFLQFGYPDEQWEDIQKTIELVRRTRPDDIGVSVSYPLPGTKFYQRVRQQLGYKTNWSDSEDLAMMFRGTYTDEFYRALHDALHAEVDTWRPQSAHEVNTESRDASAVGELWRKVEELEKTCHSDQPTTFPGFGALASESWAD